MRTMRIFLEAKHMARLQNYIYRIKKGCIFQISLSDVITFYFGFINLLYLSLSQ